MAERTLTVKIVGDSRQLEKSFKNSSTAAGNFDRNLGRATRGALAGSGVFSGLGRSLAFASGSFLTFATAADFIRDSIDAAQEAVVAQKSLAAQMKASGESFKANQIRIEAVARSYSRFGFQNDEVIASLTVLERGTRSIDKALQLQQLTADIARAKNLRLADAAAIVAKVFGGQETALRRAIPGLQKNAHGWDLIGEAQKRVAGQAAANTTAAERFQATLHDTEEIIGTALLPSLNKILDRLSKWMSNTENQAKLQAAANDAATVGATVFSALADAVSLSANAYNKLNSAFKTIPGNNGSLIKAIFGSTPPGQTLTLLKKAEGFLDKFHRGDFAAGATGGGGGGDFGPSGIASLGAAITALLGSRTGGGRPLSLKGQFNVAELRLARAELTKTLADDRKILVVEAAITRQQLEHAKKLKDRTALTQQLGSILDKIRGIDEASAQAAKDAAAAEKERRKEARQRLHDALQARQFLALGLDASGSPLTPSVKALRRELVSVNSAIEGTFLDTKKTQSVLSKIRRVLSGGLGAATKDVRAQIKSMLDDIDQQLKDHVGQRTKFQKLNSRTFFAGLGLDPAELRAARARLSRVTSGGRVSPFQVGGGFGGAGDLVIHSHLNVDGREVARNTTRHQQKTRRRNPSQRRGPHAGGGI